MPTFSDGESGASIRSKLNSTIATVDALTDQYAWKTIAVSGQDSVVADAVDDTLTLVAGTGMSITTNAAGDSITFAATAGGGGVDQIVYVSKTAAEAATFSAAPDTLLLSGFNAANEFGYAKAYAYAGTTDPGHAGVVTIQISNVNHYYQPDTDGMVTPQMYGGNEEGVRQALQRGRWVDLGVGKTYSIQDTIGITSSNPEIYVIGEDVLFQAGGSRGVAAQGAVIAFSGVQKLYWSARCKMNCEIKFSGGLVVSALNASSEIYINGVTVHDVNYNSAGTDAYDYLLTEGVGSAGTGLKTGAYWTAIGIGIEGWYNPAFEASAPLQYASLHVEDCHIGGQYGVIRAQIGGYSNGFYLGQALKTRFINCTVDGVYLNTGVSAPSGWTDADGVKYFNRYISSSNSYYYGDFVMEGCTIKNCQGRFVKTQQNGYSVIRKNTFVLDRVMNASSEGFDLINASGAWYAIDEQEMPSQVDDNVFEFQCYINDVQQNAAIVIHRGGSGSVPYVDSLTVGTKPWQGDQGFGSFRRNRIVYRTPFNSAAYRLGKIITNDFGPMISSGVARHLTFDYSDNVAISDDGWNSVASGLYVATSFWIPSTGDIDSIGATVVFRVNRNYAETRYFTDTSGVVADTNILSEVTNNTHSTAEVSSTFALGVGTEVTRDNTTI